MRKPVILSAPMANETRISKVSICKSCHHGEKEAKAEVMARNGVFVILGAFAWFEKIGKAPSQETAAVLVVAPKVTAAKPRLIPPGE